MFPERVVINDSIDWGNSEDDGDDLHIDLALTNNPVISVYYPATDYQGSTY